MLLPRLMPVVASWVQVKPKQPRLQLTYMKFDYYSYAQSKLHGLNRASLGSARRQNSALRLELSLGSASSIDNNISSTLIRKFI